MKKRLIGTALVCVAFMVMTLGILLIAIGAFNLAYYTLDLSIGLSYAFLIIAVGLAFMEVCAIVAIANYIGVQGFYEVFFNNYKRAKLFRKKGVNFITLDEEDEKELTIE